jgi:hypothetical protein
VFTRRVDPERGKSTVNGENRMLMEVVAPEPLTGDHVPFRKETGKSEFMEGERGVVVEKGRQCQKRYLLRYKVLSLSRPAWRTSNSIFNNAHSLLRHPLGPNSKTLSLCSCLFHTRSTPWMVCTLDKMSLWKEREGWLWKKGDSVSQKRLSQGEGNRQVLRSLFEGLCLSM